MHEVADAYLAKRMRLDPFAEGYLSLSFTNPENDEECRLDPEEWVPHVANFVNGVLNIYDEAVLLYGEENVEFINEGLVHVYRHDCWGSVDAAIITPETLDVCDFKGGSGKIVSADAPQLKTYASGLLPKKGYTKYQVRLHIAQLANEEDDGWSTYACSGKEIARHHSTVVKAIEKSYKAATCGEEPTVDNIGDHCGWCPRLATCPAHHAQALAALDIADEVSMVETLPVDKLVKLLGMAPTLRTVLKAAEERAQELLLAGEDVPGYKLVAGRSNRKWNPDLTDDGIASEIQEMADMAGVDLDPWKKSLISFTAVEKKLGKGNVDRLVVKPEAAPTLVPAEDRRPAIDFTEVLNDD